MQSIDSVPKFSCSLKEKWALLAYRVIINLLLPLVALALIYKVCCRSKIYASRWYERFGWIPKAPQHNGVLFHCVSVGEVNAASIIISTLLEEHSHIPLTITCTTPTGSRRIKELFGNKVHHFYLPFDSRCFMQIVMRKVKPRSIAIAEVELWPNLMQVCYEQDIPCILVNGRMTNKAVKKYSKHSALFRPMINKFTAIIPQSTRDFDNYLKLGADQNILWPEQNLKYDQLSKPNLSTRIKDLKTTLSEQKRKVVIAGSTHKSEEKFWLKTLHRLKLECAQANWLLIVAPRHPERFEKVVTKIKKQNLNLVSWSSDAAIKTNTDVLLIDCIGVLDQAYSLADIAFVGGSLINRGGHNPLEAAQYGIPIIMGPHYQNNQQITESLIDASALHIIDSSKAAQKLLLKWYIKPKLAEKTGGAGIGVIKRNKGKIHKVIEAIVH